MNITCRRKANVVVVQRKRQIGGLNSWESVKRCIMLKRSCTKCTSSFCCILFIALYRKLSLQKNALVLISAIYKYIVWLRSLLFPKSSCFFHLEKCRTTFPFLNIAAWPFCQLVGSEERKTIEALLFLWKFRVIRDNDEIV